MQWASSTIRAVLGQWTQMMGWSQSCNDWSSILASLAHWSQTGLSSSNQSNSRICANAMASNRSFLLPTHPHDAIPKQFWSFVLSTAVWRIAQSLRSMGTLRLRCFTEASLTFHIFTCLDASRLCSTRSERSWTARHGKPFQRKTPETRRHIWWPQQTGQRQGHQRSRCHETSTSTTMNFRINVVFQPPKRKAKTMIHCHISYADGLKSALDEQCEATSMKTHAI